MRILITGGTGLLGKSLVETAPPEHEIETTWYTNYTDIGLPTHQLNVGDPSQASYVFSGVRPEVVIHCAANGSVDYAEQNYQMAHMTNVGGTANIMKSARDHGAKVIYISSNAVFDGREPPYEENNPRRPVNAYGSIKKQAEDTVRAGLHWVIVRPFLLYGWPYPGGRQNWATIIADRLSQGKPLKLVNDVVWMPTYALDCAAAVWQLIDSDNEIYHVAGEDRITLYDFGLKVAEVFGLDAGLLEPVESDYFKAMARRPKDTTYLLSKINGLGIKLNGVGEGLKLMKAAGEAAYKKMAGGHK
ncbi:MAG: SDR family oxidoreductase [Planctomycetota bacterium]|jgi:dTDP-4-dehydrorhamnose reductase